MTAETTFTRARSRTEGRGPPARRARGRGAEGQDGCHAAGRRVGAAGKGPRSGQGPRERLHRLPPGDRQRVHPVRRVRADLSSVPARRGQEIHRGPLSRGWHRGPDRARGSVPRQRGTASCQAALARREHRGDRLVRGQAEHQAAELANTAGPGGTRGRDLMEFRHLGRSGLKVSEIAYGNWITHGSQVAEDAAMACIATALDEGITTFDTADVYAGTKAEDVLGRGLDGVRRESVEICTKVFWPTGPGVIESEIVPLCEKEGVGQIVWSPIAQGTLTGKYLPGAAPPAGSRATDSSGSRFIAEYLTDAILGRVRQLRPVAEEAGLTLSQLAVAWTLQNPNVTAAIVGASRPEQVRENVKASGVRLDPAVLARIDVILGPVIVRDPAQTESPATRP